MFIDALHPVHEGRLYRWGHRPTESSVLEYGRTNLDALAASGFNPNDVEAAPAASTKRPQQFSRRGPIQVSWRLTQGGQGVSIAKKPAQT